MAAHRTYRCQRCSHRGVVCIPDEDYVVMGDIYQWECGGSDCSEVLTISGEAWEIGECPEGSEIATRIKNA